MTGKTIVRFFSGRDFQDFTYQDWVSSSEIDADFYEWLSESERDYDVDAGWQIERYLEDDIFDYGEDEVLDYLYVESIP